MSAEQLYDERDRWLSELVEADLRVTALTQARDKARGERDTLGRIVQSMESLERRRQSGGTT